MGEFNYGGQAVMEGVMMRGAKSLAVAVRAPNGQIVLHSEPLNQTIYGSWIAKTPFVRGITMLWDTLVLGMRTLMFSADVAVSDATGSANTAAGKSANQPGESAFSGPVAWGSLLLAAAIAVGLFFLLPAFLTSLADAYIHSAFLSNLVEGLIRLVLVLLYIGGVGLLPDIRRVFQYHGAEHKTVHAYEAGHPLTIEAIRAHTTAHERCGTAFTLTIVIISMLIFALLGRPTMWMRLLSRIVLLPIIISISYEWLRFSAKHSDHPWMRLVLAPGLALQKLTTREPDDSMIEVAIVALRRVLQDDGIVLEGEVFN